MSLPLTAVKLIKVSPRCNIPVASAPWDYWRVTIIQSNEPLIPSITVNERRQSALFQTGRHTHRGRERSEMSIGTCWIPQVSQCAAVCMGARLILRLYAKFALSNAQRRGPRPHKPPDPPPPNRHTRTHARALQGWCVWGGSWSDKKWRESKLVDVVTAAHSCYKYCTLFFLKYFVWQDDRITPVTGIRK